MGICGHDRAYQPGPRLRHYKCVRGQRLRLSLFGQLIGHRDHIVPGGGEAGIVDGPLVDSSNGQLWAFVSDDTNGSVSGTTACASTACSGVVQLPTNFGSNTKFTESVIGVSNTNKLYIGAFDNAYWTSSSGTGNLYVNGSTGGEAAKLMQIPLTAAAFVTAGLPVRL